MSIVSAEAVARRDRRLAGLPREADPRQTWLSRKLAGPQTWVVLGVALVVALGLWLQHRTVSTSLMEEIRQVTEELGSPTELTLSQFDEALKTAAFTFGHDGFRLFPGALWTLLFYVVVFFLIDRLRPTSPSMKFVALGWGAGVATLVSLYVNTWASQLANVEGPVDPTSGARAAIFIAPFVEEATKATAVFLLAIAARYRLVSHFQVIALAGLSGVGFAFTENLIYYVRQFIYASKIFGNDAVEQMQQLMWLRGVATSFGHPLFTALTAVGVVIALRAHSRLVRILAPLTGYVLAATLHMLFNGIASTSEDATSILVGGGLLLVIMGLFWLWRQLGRQRALLTWRLDDYVRMGWLMPSDPLVFDKVRLRLKLSTAALLRGWRTYRATLTLIANLTELAYLRASLGDGLVDDPGLVRERELLIDIRALRGLALDDPAGLPVIPEYWRPRARLRAWWTRRRSRRADYAPPSGAPLGAGPPGAYPGRVAYPPPRPVGASGTPYPNR